MKASANIFIARPIADVWNFVANVHNMDRWVNGVTKPTPTSDGVWGLGSTFKSDYTYAGKTHTVEFVITEFNPPNRMSMRSASGPFPFEGCTELRKEKDGTRLTNMVDAKPSGALLTACSVLLAAPLRILMNAQLRKELARVKAILEEE